MERPSTNMATYLAVQEELLKDLCEKQRRQAEELELQCQRMERQEQKLSYLEQEVREQGRQVREKARQGHVDMQPLPETAPPLEEAIVDGQDATSDLEPSAVTLAPVTMQKSDAHVTSYPFEGSVWDSGIFLGFPCIDAATGLTILLGIVATIAVDACFILIVFANYSENPFSDEWLRGLLHWRAVTAHDVQFADPESHVSFAASVCAEDSALTTSGKIDQTTDFNGFRRPGIDELRNLNGWFLSIMALLVWYFSILQEIGMNYLFTRSVLAHRGTAASMLASGDQIKVISFSMPQVMRVLLLITLPRLIISFGLGYSGILFLAYTQNVGDLLLNAMALMFILDMDETFYHGMLPLRVKNLMEMLEPLSFPRLRLASSMQQVNNFVSGGLHHSLSRILLVVGGLLLANFTLLEPFNDRMDTASHFLCGGNKDFVYTTNFVSNVVLYAESPPFDVDEAYKSAYVKKAVLKIIGLDPRRLEVVGAYSPSDASNSDKIPYEGIVSVNEGGREFSSSRLYCVDHTNTSIAAMLYPSSDPQSFQDALRDSLGMTSFIDCSKLTATQCSSVANTVPRALCPETCGCNNPWRGQFYSKGFYGCPATCDVPWELNAYYLPPQEIDAFTNMCLDVSPDVLRAAPSWWSYQAGLLGYLTNFVGEGQGQSLVSNLNENGCRALLDLRSVVDICLPGTTYHSMRLWCPRTCQCATSDLKECPRSCGSISEYELISPPETCTFGSDVRSESECYFAAHAKLGVNFTSAGRDTCLNTSCSCLYDSSSRTVNYSNAGSESQQQVTFVVCRLETPLFFHSRTPLYNIQKVQAECHLQGRAFDPDSTTCTSQSMYTTVEEEVPPGYL